MADKATSTAGKILHNSFWYGLEQVMELIVFLGTSIAVARFFGPSRMGYFSYINFFVTIVTRTSGSGLAGATRKYMAEFLALNRPGAARAVYQLAYRYQVLAGIAIAALSLVAVLAFGDPDYRGMSVLLILSIIPGVLSWVPAQANQAFEDVYENTTSAVGYILSYALIIALTLYFHWGLVGIASAQLIGRTVEVLLRTPPLHRRLRLIPLETLERVVILRIRTFCLQAVGIQLLMSIVWDRSELFFLNHFAPLESVGGVLKRNFTQLGFYSVSFTLANNLLVIPRAFGSATGISLMVESVRDPTRIDPILRNACRYLLFVVFPVHLGAAAIAAQALALGYGDKYVAAIPVVIVASLLSIPRAFQEIAEVLLRAADRQKQILVWFGITGVLNIALDLYLIPRYQAVGAAWGNGLAQLFGIVAIWVQARRVHTFSFPLRSGVRLLAAAVVMGAVSFAVVNQLPFAAYLGHTPAGFAGLVSAVLAAAITYIVGVRLLHGLQPSDRERLQPIGNRLPGPARLAYLAVLTFITPAAASPSPTA
jgi:O-antigen/teichoic acid export membrane protein